MPQLSAETKHAILLHARSRGADQSLDDVAAVHGVAGGRRTLAKWRRKWDGTPRSLQRKAGSGKQRILSKAQVSRHVRAPLLAANRAHRPVHYTTLLPTVRQKTRTQVSLRTVQRLGKQELGAKVEAHQEGAQQPRVRAHARGKACVHCGWCCVLTRSCSVSDPL
jgi:hypothetical protein